MKRLVLATGVLLLSACASTPTPKETRVTVGALLAQIQVAVNDISAGTRNSSLPPFQSAEVTLSTTASQKSEGGGSLVLSAGGSETTSSSNTITLDLVPNPNKVSEKSVDVGRRIAASVIAAVTAVDENHDLKLKSLTVEAGLDVNKSVNGGIEITLVGISINGKRTSESSSGNSLKLIFAYPDKAAR